MKFRVRKPMIWAGTSYEIGDVVEIEEGHPRLRVMIEQSHYLEYANTNLGTEELKPTVTILKE